MGGAAVANYVSILEAVALIPTSNLAHLLLQTARRFPDRPALIWRDRTWTWAEFCARVQAAAGALAARGVRHGDRILLHARNSNAVLETMWASWMLGAVWVPTNFRLTPPEVALSGAVLRRFGAYLRRRLPRARGGGECGKSRLRGCMSRSAMVR